MTIDLKPVRLGIIDHSVNGLGLVASGKRKIKSGSEFEALYDKSALIGTNPILGDGDTYDTLNDMAGIIRTTLADTKRVAPALAGSSREQTLRNVWNHVYSHFQYEKDADGIEQMRRPSRSWLDRKFPGIDCDCMSIVIGSLLTNLNIGGFSLRKAEYKEEVGWQHVYVVVPKKESDLDSLSGIKHLDRSKYYVLDCVVDKFNYEVPFNKKYDQIMKRQYLNGDFDAATVNGGISSSLSRNIQADNSYLYNLGCEFDGIHALSGIDGVDDATLQNSFLRGLKQHLINTRAILAINPALTQGLYNPAVFAQRLDSLINSFDDSDIRNKVLGQIIYNESKDGMNGELGAFFQKVGTALKTAAKKAGTAVKAAAKFVVRYNPATVAIRAGMLLAMKINLFRQSEKLGYGLWDEKSALEKGLDISVFRQNKDAFNKVVNIYKKLGGKEEKIKNAIRQGWLTGVKKHKLVNGLGGAPATGNTPQVRAALPLLQLVERDLKSVNYKSVKRTNQSTALNDLYQAIRTNKGGMATMLSFAYKPSAEANRYNMDEYRKLLASARNIEKLVQQNGGTAAQLRQAVDAGKMVAITKQGLGVVETASTAAASGILATIASFLKKIDFKKMFKGKADSPHFVESEMKNFDVTAEMDADTFDEGDPNAQVDPVSKILSDNTDTRAIVNKLTTSPQAATFTNLVPSKAQAVVDKLSHSQAATLLSKIAQSPVAQKIVNTPLAQKLIARLRKAKAKVAAQVQAKQPQPAKGQSGKEYFKDAEVVESTTNKPNNALKYGAIALGTGVAIYAVSMMVSNSKKKTLSGPGEEPIKAELLNGPTAKSKTKSSQRAPKKAMAITI